jgi:hypothetical protein
MNPTSIRTDLDQLRLMACRIAASAQVLRAAVMLRLLAAISRTCQPAKLVFELGCFGCSWWVAKAR